MATGYGHGDFFSAILVQPHGFSDTFSLFQLSSFRVFTTGQYSGMEDSSCCSKDQQDSALKNGFCSQEEDFWYKESGKLSDFFSLQYQFFHPSVYLFLVDLPSPITSTGRDGSLWVGPLAFHSATAEQDGQIREESTTTPPSTDMETPHTEPQ